MVAGLTLSFALVAWAHSSLPTASSKPDTSFRFAILGDRTGEPVRGVYEEVWRETDADHPDFVINVGDTIQGGKDESAEAQWRQVMQTLAPFRRYRIFFVPGNHDVWSPLSAQLYERYTRHPLHYSFNYKQAHFTVLNNSEDDSLGPAEIDFLKTDLQRNSNQRLKFIFFHRPSWLLHALLKNPDFPLHQIAVQYGVQYVVCGHLHEMLRFEVGPVTYLSMASAGGHLREPKTYDAGWFFGHTLVTVRGNAVEFAIKELQAPFGKGRISGLKDWSTKNFVTGSVK